MSIYTNINDFSKKAGFLVDQVAIGMRIKEIRQYYNLTVEEFADILNISVNAVYKWQRGDSAPDITNIGIICGKFDVRIEYLMFGTGDCFRAVSCSIFIRSWRDSRATSEKRSNGPFLPASAGAYAWHTWQPPCSNPTKKRIH